MCHSVRYLEEFTHFVKSKSASSSLICPEIPASRHKFALMLIEILLNSCTAFKKSFGRGFDNELRGRINFLSCALEQLGRLSVWGNICHRSIYFGRLKYLLPYDTQGGVLAYCVWKTLRLLTISHAARLYSCHCCHSHLSFPFLFFAALQQALSYSSSSL